MDNEVSSTDTLIDAQMLAVFSNLTPAEVAQFRNGVAPYFLPASFWDVQSIMPGAASAEFAWQFVQRGLQEAWAKRFPLDLSIQLIVALDKYSQLERALQQIPEMSNQEIANMSVPAMEVWPFQRAVMYLAVNSWRARFCPNCGKRFVATKPKSTYCSDACFSQSRKGAKRAWWLEHGEQWRAKDSKKRKKEK
jgi:hypothetical protein